MAGSCRFRTLPVTLALLAAGASFSVFTTHATQPPEDLAASGGVVPQSGNCSAARPDDERCLPGGPQGQTGPGQSVIPPVPPITPPAPPVTPPITPPPFPLTPGHIDPQGSPPLDPYSALFFTGWAKARLHVKGDDQDITYESNRADLLFWRSNNQQMPGNTHYLLTPVPEGPDSKSTPLSVTWTAKGRVGDCTVEGKTAILFYMLHTDIVDPTRPAYGHLYVIGPDGGDFHSVIISAFNPDARLKKTCPGNPPTVTEEPFEAGYLLHIVFRKNMYEERGLLVLSGMQVLDADKPDAILDMLPPGPGRDIASQALSHAQASSSRTSRVYTWEWALYPYGNYDEGLGQPH